VNIEGLSLDQMEAALAVAESGSFSAAARRFRRTQSSLSYAVAALEQQLGITLFDRSDGRRPRPTEQGQLLLREMEIVVRQATALKGKAKVIAAGLEPEISFAIDDHYPIEELLPLLRLVQHKYPSVHIRLNVETMGAVTQAVIDDRAVFGLTASVPDLPAGVLGDALATLNRVLVASPEHPLAKPMNGAPRPTQGDALEQVQIVLGERRELSRRDYRVHSGRTWRVGDLHTKHRLLLAGLGWGYLPAHMVADDLESGRLRRLNIEGLPDRNSVAVMLVRKRDRTLGPVSRMMLTWFLPSLPQVSTSKIAG